MVSGIPETDDVICRARDRRRPSGIFGDLLYFDYRQSLNGRTRHCVRPDAERSTAIRILSDPGKVMQRSCTSGCCVSPDGATQSLIRKHAFSGLTMVAVNEDVPLLRRACLPPLNSESLAPVWRCQIISPAAGAPVISSCTSKSFPSMRLSPRLAPFSSGLYASDRSITANGDSGLPPKAVTRAFACAFWFRSPTVKTL